MTSHEQVVDAFNTLGYTASFGAVAEALPGSVDVKSLYSDYPSREALGEAWLTDQIPSPPLTTSLHEAFSTLACTLLRQLENKRDFSRSWLAALKVSGLLHLPQLSNLHDGVSTYFMSWLDANQANLSFPSGVRYDDIRTELSDSLCVITLLLVGQWEVDRSIRYAQTLKMVDATAYLLDGLLMRRADFGEASLLVHLHSLGDQQRLKFLRPLLDILIKPERAGRFGDPLSLLEALRTLQPSPAKRV